MNFHYSPKPADKRDKKLQRFFEMIPATLSWTILIGLLVLSLTKPVISAILIIAFDLYWLLKLFYITLFLSLSYVKLSLDKDTDWMERVRGIDRLPEYLGELEKRRGKGTFSQRLSLWLHTRHLKALATTLAKPPRSDDIYQLVIVPIAKEGRDIVEPNMAALTRSQFPPDRIIVALALEDRASHQAKEEIRELAQKYSNIFCDLQLIIHPDGLPGEAAVKGANITYAARRMTAYFEERKIPVENIIVSCFDADTVIDPKYFSCLTYYFLCHPDRNRASFQPIPVYSNNIWDVPVFARILEMGSSCFQMVEATNPEKLVTFSSHSMSFKALVEVGYWPTDMISDDSAIFWKAYIYYDGHYSVVPISVTLLMNVVDSGQWFKTLCSVYKQKRRWAWGIENFPILMRGFLKAHKISWYDRFRHLFKMIEGHLSWATWPFLLTVMSWLPAIFASREFSQTVLYYSASRITSIIFDLSFLALAVTVILSLALLPKEKARISWFRRIIFTVEWILFLPIIFTVLSGAPAMDAQTRLMLGKRLEFWVSDKKK